MKKIKVSIVVPIYNVEKYIDECINSIINQTYKNLEIILVDDESPDNCPAICDNWAKKDKRIKVIHKKNEGLGLARNSGMEIATGDYICFLDSDDYIEHTTIEKCINIINQHPFDAVFFGHDSFDENGIKNKYIPSPEKFEYYDNKSIVEGLLPNLIIDIPNSHKTNMILSACMCLLNLSLIQENNWNFISERIIISEDIYSMFKLIKQMNSVAIINEAFYHYRVNNNSLTHTFRKDRFEKIKTLYYELNKISENLNENIKIRFDYLFVSYEIVCLKHIVDSNLKFKQKLIEIKKICRDDINKLVIKSVMPEESFKRKILLFFIKHKNTFMIYILCLIQNAKKR